MSWPRKQRGNQDKWRRAIPTPSVLSDQKWIAYSTASWEACPHFQACSGPAGAECSPLPLVWDVKETDKEIVVETELPGLGREKFPPHRSKRSANHPG